VKTMKTEQQALTFRAGRTVPAVYMTLPAVSLFGALSPGPNPRRATVHAGLVPVERSRYPLLVSSSWSPRGDRGHAMCIRSFNV